MSSAPIDNAASTAPLQILKLLADDARWRLIEALRFSDHQVGELVALLGMPQNLISYHLGLLRQAGLVQVHRSDADARVTYYGLDLAALQAAYQQIGGGLALPGVAIPHPSADAAPSVIFLCTKNSARSQMAEGWLRHVSGGQVLVRSAGTQPASIHPLAIEAMREVGIDIGYQRSKGVDSIADFEIGLVVTVCDLAREECPPALLAKPMWHWSIPDPVRAQGDRAAQLDAFRSTRNQLRARVEGLIAALPNLPQYYRAP
jgi:ArsR family transcriptional regulator, arsenate/arsenite/antimonite-responsive transcriptional repressor / arsenate reductase (thioredoxin)